MLQYTLASAADASSFTSSVKLDLGDLKSYSIQVSFSGSNVVGTLTLVASDDDSIYTTVANSSVAVTASASTLYDVRDAGYRYVKVSWAYTSGTGNITIKAAVKESWVRGA